MKRGFSDYPKYLIPEGKDNDTPTTFEVEVFLPSSLPSEIEKAIQILSAIQIAPERVKITRDISFDAPFLYFNAMKASKVTKAVVFGTERMNLASNVINTILEEGDLMIIFTHELSVLIDDEKNKIAHRRLALWKSLKKWIP